MPFFTDKVFTAERDNPADLKCWVHANGQIVSLDDRNNTCIVKQYDFRSEIEAWVGSGFMLL